MLNQYLEYYKSATILSADSKEYKEYKYPLYDCIIEEYFDDWNEILEYYLEIYPETKPVLWAFGAKPKYIEFENYEDTIAMQLEYEFEDEVTTEVLKECKTEVDNVQKAIDTLEAILKFKNIYAIEPDFSLVILPPERYILKLHESNILPENI
jgi:hypothetical protein